MMEIMDSKFITYGQLNEEYRNAIQNKIITQELIDDIISRNHKNDLGIFNTHYDEIYQADIKAYIEYNLNNDLSTYDSEEFRTSYRILLAYFVFKDSYDDYVEDLHEKTMGKYSMRKMLQFRFIKENAPEEYKKISNELDSNIESIVEKIVENANANDKNYVKDKELFENYLQNRTDHLEKIIREITEKTLSKGIKGFNCLDYCFFNFILDTYDTPNAKNYRQKAYHLVDPYYISIIEYGITAIAKCYYSDLDREIIKMKLKRIRELSNPKIVALKDAIQLLDSTINGITRSQIVISDEILSKAIDKVKKATNILNKTQSK